MAMPLPDTVRYTFWEVGDFVTARTVLELVTSIWINGTKFAVFS
jgi:hypothetical protein